MAEFLARRWRQQPQGAVQVDWSNPLTRDLRFLHYGVQRPLLIGWGGAETRTNITAGRSQDGLMSFDFSGSSSIVIAASAVPAEPAELTLFGVAAIDDVSAERTVVDLSDASNNNLVMRWQHRSSGPTGYTFQLRGSGGASLTSLAVGTAATLGKLSRMVGVYRSGTQVKQAWVDGISLGTSNNNLVTVVPNRTSVGCRFVTAPQALWDGMIPVAGIALRAWSAGEVAEWTANPWQLFRPLRPTIYSLPSAGTTYNESLTESAAANDSVAGLGVFARAVTEAAAAVDTVNATCVFTRAIAEAAAAADAVTTGGAVYAVGVAETASAADTVASAAIFTRSVAEAGAATDQVLAQLVAVSAFAEVGVAVDVIAASGGTVISNVFRAAVNDALAWRCTVRDAEAA